jgi:hypothetical protein
MKMLCKFKIHDWHMFRITVHDHFRLLRRCTRCNKLMRNVGYSNRTSGWEDEK